MVSGGAGFATLYFPGCDALSPVLFCYMIIPTFFRGRCCHAEPLWFGVHCWLSGSLAGIRLRCLCLVWARGRVGAPGFSAVHVYSCDFIRCVATYAWESLVQCSIVDRVTNIYLAGSVGGVSFLVV